MLIDTHAHLDDERFAVDLPAVLERARAAGVGRAIAIATTAPTSHACIALAERFAVSDRCATVRATVGIQPNHVAEAGPGDWDEVVRLAPTPRVVGIGETGLDRHWKHTPFEMQQDYFTRHLELGRRLDRAVVIHCREAEADTVAMLRAEYDRHGPIRAVMHSFSGDLATAQSCLAMGLCISFAGMLTYKSAQNLRDVAAQVPLDRVLVETDAPYLAPVPMRGQRNEPAYVVHTATCLAALLGVTVEVLAEQTSTNTRRLFQL